MNNLDNMEILVSGGAGSLGKAVIKLLQRKYKPHGIRIYSRDEYKQFHFKKELQKLGLDKNVSFLIGDIRDEKRLTRAMKGVDIVIHAAALKQIQACNDNPIEATATNIQGTANVITTAMNSGVAKVMYISTDKCVHPVNLYGATKMVAEMLCLHANIYHSTKFSCCRYGNVLGSRGSIVPLFGEQAKTGKITITHKDMCRFWITLENVSEFLLDRIQEMSGNEVFIPKMMIAKVIDIAKTIAPNAEIIITEPSPGEKIQETLITEEESKHTYNCNNYFIMHPKNKNKDVFSYISDPKEYKISQEELTKVIESIK